MPEAKGSGEPRFGPEIEETDVLGPASWRLWMVEFVFCDFYCSDLGIPFYCTQHLAKVSKVAKQNKDFRPCLVHPKNPKLFKISRHIKSYGTCIEH